jgi:hypothetical protein
MGGAAQRGGLEPELLEAELEGGRGLGQGPAARPCQCGDVPVGGGDPVDVPVGVFGECPLPET